MNTVDKLGKLLAQQEALEQEIKRLKGEIINAGEGKHDGELFRANVVLANRANVEWKSVAAELNIPADVISKHTKTSAVISVRVTSK